MIWIALIFFTLIACEAFLRLPLKRAAQDVLRNARRAGAVVGAAGISDHWKEKALPRYAVRIATAAMLIFASLLLALVPLLIFYVLAEAWRPGGGDVLLSWQGTLVCMASAFAYVYVRSRLVGGGDASAEEEAYSPLDRMLHRIVLASPAVGEALLDIERRVAPTSEIDPLTARHIYVIGLARAGTTALVRALHASGHVASLTYRDMPFVMAPNLWSRVAGLSRRNIAERERAHGDRVNVGGDSPEALEEPFWRTYCGADYIKPDALVPHVVNDDVVAKYRDFVRHVLVRHGAGRYLAKNNNGVVRIEALRRAFPEATILVPVRDPLEQARSLMRQHRRFVAQGDGFQSDYMRWLAHHEFGADHRPFVISAAPPQGSTDDPGYWIAIWIDVYQALLERAGEHPEHILPVAYEDLCAPDLGVWSALSDRLGLDPTRPTFTASAGAPATDDRIEGLDRAREIYRALRALSRRRLGIPPAPEAAHEGDAVEATSMISQR